ncbi:MAG: hypothetical protein JRG89_19290 [Deltaproteobacteria bacterium]|nr:hypothetical protein [Deltaproteobacteria bacterium]
MTQFEYIAIPVSLIMTFGIVRLLSGLPHLLINGAFIVLAYAPFIYQPFRD